MRKWLSFPVDETKLNGDYSRAMLMALVVHVFYKDWGTFGSLGVLALCFLWALLQSYVRFKEIDDRRTAEQETKAKED